MLNRVHAALAVAALVLVACVPKPQAERPLAAGEEQVIGQIVRIEDGAYPMFYVHVIAPGQDAELSFDLNAEDADLDGRKPADFAQRNVTVTYVAERKPNLMDIRVNDQSVLGEAAPASPLAGARRISGVLSGASAISGGDLPDEITVTDAAGNAVAFEYFVVPSMIAADGKQVTAYYADDTRNRITAIRPK